MFNVYEIISRLKRLLFYDTLEIEERGIYVKEN